MIFTQKNIIHKLELDQTLEKVQIIFTVPLLCLLPWALVRTFSSVQFSSVHFSSVTQSCPTLCDPMNCSTPGLPVHHQLPEFTQTSPFSPAPNPSQHQSLFQ